MKSEPPTPTRATDNQFRQMQYQLNYIRNTSLLNVLGLGSGAPIPSVMPLSLILPGLLGAGGDGLKVGSGYETSMKRV